MKEILLFYWMNEKIEEIDVGFLVNFVLFFYFSFLFAKGRKDLKTSNPRSIVLDD